MADRPSYQTDKMRIGRRRKKDPRIQVETMLHIEVVAGVGLRHITIGVSKFPLPTGGAGIVARRRRGVKTDLAQNVGMQIVHMEVAADSKVRKCNFVGSKDVARSDDGMVLRMAEVVGVTNVRANLGSEIFGCVGSILGTGITVEPSEIGEGEGL